MFEEKTVEEILEEIELFKPYFPELEDEEASKKLLKEIGIAF